MTNTGPCCLRRAHLRHLEFPLTREEVALASGGVAGISSPTARQEGDKASPELAEWRLFLAESPRKWGQAPHRGAPGRGVPGLARPGATFTVAICSQERGTTVGVGLPAWPAPSTRHL
ncbi:unnamed protein product [Pipistrellus nathusii]|uniref:Uncharacterized protein n=1 Tax=Pipistrellus nathusii TaxID=59473 RepID=A0ABP0ALS3_PIPNA